MKRLRLWLALLFASICSLQGVYAATSNSQLLSEASDEDTPFFTEEDSAQIVVSLLEPGSLGTEVLYNVNHINDVYNLKVIGEMNEEDWARIKIMQNLYILDLSEAITDVVPANTFRDNKVIKRIKLPNTIKIIGDYAFDYASNLEAFDFPGTAESVGSYAFRGSSIKSIDLHEIKTINYRAFYYCGQLESVVLSDSVKKIDQYAFAGCNKLNLRLPKYLEELGSASLDNIASDTIIFPNSLKDYGVGEFKFCARSLPNVVYVEFPMTFYNAKNEGLLKDNTQSLKTVVLKSSTVVDGDYKTDMFIRHSYRNYSDCGLPFDSIDLIVPDFLVNNYKQDNHWYQFNVKGFNSADTKDWVVYNPLYLTTRQRINGLPNLELKETATFKLIGDEVQNIDTLTTYTHGNDDKNATTKVLVNSDAVKIKGLVVSNYYTSKNKWYFISLPFDIKVSDIVPANGGKYAIRYYDGAGRALNGATGNWKNYEADDIIEAGTGFIYQTSQDGWTTFVSLDNESKQNIASNKMFVKALEANPSEKNSNKGWNLVGNPWQAYFNNHSVNFTAPITVWNGTTYVAYSLIDDDYAIKPNEAFFVQCPEEINSISFPITGRQLTSEITNQSGAKPRMFGANLENRQLIDLSVAKGDLMDKTRVVVNEGASADYETGVDASKFFSMDGAVPQVYTLVGEATECAINERPVGEGFVKVGFIAPEEGSYTFALVRNEAKTVMLIDHETGSTTDLTAGEYNFTAAQGTWNNRFELMITPAEPTAIEGVDGNKETKVAATDAGIVVEGTEGRVVVYSVDGKKVAEQPVDGTATISVAKGAYLVRTAKGTAKVTVR